MDKVALIKAEIERRITDNTFGAKLELIDILAWLDSLESEKPMNQEEEINLWISENENIHHGDKLMVWLLKDVARHFAQWGYREGFLEGTKIQREEDNQLVDTIYQQGIEKGKDEILNNSVIVECGVRVYPELDGEPDPWVSLFKHGIDCDSLNDIPELVNLGFRDDDTAIVIIKRKV